MTKKIFEYDEWVKDYVYCIQKSEDLFSEMSDMVAVAVHNKKKKTKVLEKMISNMSVACISMCEIVDMLKTIPNRSE